MVLDRAFSLACTLTLALKLAIVFLCTAPASTLSLHHIRHSQLQLGQRILSSRCRIVPTASKAIYIDEHEKQYNQPAVFGAVSGAPLLGAVVTTLIAAPALQSAPKLFFLHVAGMASGALVFFLASLSAVRSRGEAARVQLAPNRRVTLTNHVKTHFYLYLATATSWAVGVGSIVAMKARQGRPHLTSAHSRVGAASLLVYCAAWFAAELKVFEKVIRERRLAFEPNFLWASSRHRLLGRLAACGAIAAVSSGILWTRYGRANLALDTPRGAAVAAGLVLLGAQEVWTGSVGVRRALGKNAFRMKRTSSNVNSNVYSNVKSNMCDPSLLEKDLTGKVALITGANTGIGLVTATQLAKQGATVVIACRDVAKGVQAAKKASPSPSLDTKNNVECMQLDLASLESVRTFAKEFQEKYPRLDFLVLNAGVMACPKSLTKDGFELQFGTNHLGHFLLANLLLPTLKKSAPSRVITLSSCAHDKMLINPPGTISFEDPNWETRRYSPWPAYSQSKLANMLFARELAKRCEGTGVTSYSLHPGFVQSSLTRHLAGQEGVGKKLFDAFAMSRVSGLGMIPVWEGTQMSLSLILTPAEKLENGAYFAQKDSPGEYEGGSETANTAATLFLDEAKDEDGEVGRRLWEMSAKLVQLNELE